MPVIVPRPVVSCIGAVLKNTSHAANAVNVPLVLLRSLSYRYALRSRGELRTLVSHESKVICE
jgi:hypothetical protein